MAIQATQIPPSDHVLPGSRLLPTAPFPDTHSSPNSPPPSGNSSRSIVEEWISDFKDLLSGDHGSTTKLFFNESYWRDLLCMTWDFHTIQGPQQISSFIQSSRQNSRLTMISLDDSSAHKSPQALEFGRLKAVRAFLKVETSIGRGEGLVRLVSDTNDGGRWKALTFFTTLKKLKGYEENIRSRRPRGTGSSLENRGRNWKDLLITQQNFEAGRQPTVLTPGMIFRIKLARIVSANCSSLSRCRARWSHCRC